MKTTFRQLFIALALLALSILNSQLSTAFAQGTAFTYQGQLNSGTPPVPANGIFNMKFLLFLDPDGNNPAPGVPPYSNSVNVINNGAFTVEVDFGPNVFTGTAYWMEIQVEQVAPNHDSSFTTLTPPVLLTPAPSAIYATTAGSFTGNVSVSQLPPTVVTTGESGVTFSGATVNGTISGDGSGMLNLNGAQVVSVGNGNPLPSSPGLPPTFSAGNFSVGPSGNATTIGSQNTAIGVYALSNNASGSGNTAIGFNALYFNTNGSYNTAIGNDALYSNNGSGNTANGNDALYLNTFGGQNTAIGDTALYFNTTGSYNTAIGDTALIENTTGSDNTAIGFEALYDNTTGGDNTAIGINALFANTSGSYNIALGYGAGFYVRFGSSNIDIGNQGALTETDNNIIRIGSGQTSTYIAGVINGNGAGLSNLTLNASQLTSVGNGNGTSPPSSENFFVGPSGNSSTTGSENTTIGVSALSNNTSGQGNTAIGFQALSNNTSGQGNTAIGTAALYDNTIGQENTAIGAGALYSNTGANNANTAIGPDALAYITNGNNNIALGSGAGSGLVGNESGNIDIGNPGNAGDINIIRIGTQGTQTACYLAGTLYANGVALTSDRNAKENFSAVDARAVLAKVASLPVTQWNYKADQTDVQHIGPMAQDFRAAFGLDGTDDKHISVVDEGGVALAAIQGLNQKLEETGRALRAKDGEIQTLKQQNDSLAERLNELEATVKQLAARN